MPERAAADDRDPLLADGRADGAGVRATLQAGVRVAGVLPDVTGLDKVFDYRVPKSLEDGVLQGAIVRVPLGGRRVRGWVVASGWRDDEGLDLKEIEEIVSVGPPEQVVEIARWASWRWSGRMRPFLQAASPKRTIRVAEFASFQAHARVAIGRVATGGSAPASGAGRQRRSDPQIDAAVQEALEDGCAVIRLPPAASRLSLVESVATARLGAGNVLVLVPTRADADILSRLLRSSGWPVAQYPDDWAFAAAREVVVVGTRSAALAPSVRLGAVVALDAHSQAYVDQRTPTWNAWVVASERAARQCVPCILASPCPSLEMLAAGRLVALARAYERRHWPVVEVIDRRHDDPRSGLYSPRLVELARNATRREDAAPAVLVLNRTGRLRLLACRACGELARCEACSSPVAQSSKPPKGEAARLGCGACSAERAFVCASCGSMRLAAIRVGTTRACEEIEALTGIATAEVTSASRRSARHGASSDRVDALATPRLAVGTESVLNLLRSASLVAFLDFDQELLAPRLRASEEAMALLALAARMTGGRGRDGRLVVQTRLPDHEVVEAAARADPGIVAAAEQGRREILRLPPFAAVALIEGDAAVLIAERIRHRASATGVEVTGPDGAGSPRYLVRASDHRRLCNALAHAREESGQLFKQVRVEVDPVRI